MIAISSRCLSRDTTPETRAFGDLLTPSKRDVPSGDIFFLWNVTLFEKGLFGFDRDVLNKIHVIYTFLVNTEWDTSA